MHNIFHRYVCKWGGKITIGGVVLNYRVAVVLIKCLMSAFFFFFVFFFSGYGNLINTDSVLVSYFLYVESFSLVFSP